MNKMSQELTIASLAPATLNGQMTGRKIYAGIDFGTSTSVVTLATYDAATKSITAHPIPIEQRLRDGAIYKEERVNTVIALKDNKILVGKGANDMKYELRKGVDVFYNFKMELGIDLGATYSQSKMVSDGPMSITRPKDAARIFFKFLKGRIDAYCSANFGVSGSDVEYAVSIPASFEANQRRDLIEALEANGIHVSKPSLIDEPNAAFLSYVQASMNGEHPFVIPSTYNPTVLVFDFGGGTCDISILEITKGAQGMQSKDLAISKFANMGGIDVDRYITYHYLLPRFLKANNRKAEDFRLAEREQIATRLYKYAEELKVKINKALSLFLDPETLTLPEIKNSEEQKEEITKEIFVDTTKGRLTQDCVYLTYKELTDTMSVFLRNSSIPTKIGLEDEYNNIFIPINSAIKKSGKDADHIDYVLLIGGSAQSPYIKEAIRKHFKESEILIPQNLQTHVSCGASIHSLLLNGFGTCVIRPITSEPIIVVTSDATPTTLLGAGTEIPCQPAKFTFRPQRNGQTRIEMPICVGNENKMLTNVVIKATGVNSGFNMTDDITVVVEMTADKLMRITARCKDQVIEVEPQNPFSNKEMTTEQRAVANAQRAANDSAVKNGGIPTKNALQVLVSAYEDADQDFMAAETYEMQVENYPENNYENKLAVMYHNAGHYDKAIELLKTAVEKQPNDATIWSNYGNDLLIKKRYKEAEEALLRSVELDSNKATALISLYNLKCQTGDKTTAKEYGIRGFDILYKKWQDGTIDEVSKGWLRSIALDLGKKSVYQEVVDSLKKDHKYYDDENLARSAGRPAGSEGTSLLE